MFRSAAEALRDNPAQFSGVQQGFIDIKKQGAAIGRGILIVGHLASGLFNGREGVRR
jgi:hypothetical protein